MSNKNFNRRKFIKLSGQTVVGTSLALPTFACTSNKALQSNQPKMNLSIQQVIDKIMTQIPGDTSGHTVDTVKIGDANQIVTGIVSTFMATVEVIERAAWLGANFIITHEPTFYNHLDNTDWIKDDQVYLYKKALLEKHNIVVWRFHDYWHQFRPDGILTGFLKGIGWEDYLDTSRENTCVIPAIKLKPLAQFVKQQFNLKRTFFIGDPNLECKSVGILPGAWGGGAQIPFLGKDIDVLLVGESAEWETVEYIRDASTAGIKKGLIIMGHARSEQDGMKYLVDWLQPMFPDLKITHVVAGDPFMPV